MSLYLNLNFEWQSSLTILLLHVPTLCQTLKLLAPFSPFVRQISLNPFLSVLRIYFNSAESYVLSYLLSFAEWKDVI